ncbi:MAG: efflux RND transporter periplasmic adaptor subunit [Deltaproteobacteria bacterium]|nr:efflux RND transporter periplasmic adaptor subunit [Deltaproteobacteria bacterium]
MKRSVSIIAGVIILALAVWGISRIIASKGSAENGLPKKPKPLVATQTVQLGEITSTLELTGSVEATRVARLASPAEGPITNCCRVREGDTVRQGAKILSIGRKKATDAMLLSAQQDLKTEQEELVSIEKLVESGAIPKDQLELARAKQARMVAQLEKMKESSEDYEVIAPWDGVISKVHVAEGNYVAARTVLVEVFDPNSLVVRMAVPEAHSQDIRLGMEVATTLDAYGGKTFRGRVSRIYPELDRRMRTRTAEVEVTDKVDLVPGMFARLGLILKSEKDTVVVPTEAVIVTPKGFRVAYVIEDGKAFQRKVTVGIEGGGKVQILAGIKPGEQIAIAGNEKLKDGVEVRVQGTEKQGSEKAKPKASSEEKGTGR